MGAWLTGNLPPKWVLKVLQALNIFGAAVTASAWRGELVPKHVAVPTLIALAVLALCWGLMQAGHEYLESLESVHRLEGGTVVLDQPAFDGSARVPLSRLLWGLVSANVLAFALISSLLGPITWQVAGVLAGVAAQLVYAASRRAAGRFMRH